ncbi:leucine-rich repeat domain-containing protein [Acinetobacter sp. HY1485]|uniref:leucine-rich repeat domain-containing protein n=1 Tax=Acinetobacter sp. HY1485 TaxID=2970918 RepID=UPI0022B94AE1|nr:leucine-rich repeat domain-containing protein [Acinetobacter sp. HY1485]
MEKMSTNYSNGFFEEVCNPYNEKNYPYGKGLLLKKWDKSVLNYINKNNIESIHINISRGWRGGFDFSFLKDLITIKELVILTGKSQNISSIENMVALESLSLTIGGKELIDFTKLKNLKNCFISWWAKAKSIFNSDSLQELYIDGLKIANYSNFKINSNLKELTIANSRIDNLNFLKNQQNLEVLHLFNCKKIIDFSPISACQFLKRIDLDGCKLTTLDFLINLKDLEILLISHTGEINTLKGISNLRNLKVIGFTGNATIIDGDLTSLTQLPLLSMVNFSSRRHYTHKVNKEWNWNNFNIPDSNLLKIKKTSNK